MAHKMYDIGLLIVGKPTRCPGRQACARTKRSGGTSRDQRPLGLTLGLTKGPSER
jgi:hypothetical protein